MSGALGKVLTGKTIAGKLRIGERLSGDPAGSIYLAVDLSTNQNVMILALAEGVRLGGEQQAAAIRHPNVLAHRFSYFPNAAQRFVATDAPSGKSLARLIAKRGPLHPGPATNVALQILSALHAIHSEETFHGNLNPHNVFVDKTDKGELEVRLLFPGSVRTESLPESVRYLAPEQILGEVVDRRADLWAVGALMYLSLFGRPPFDGADQEAISGKILLKDPVFPPEAEKLPADLVSVIRAALTKEPDKRPQFANSVIGDLLATAEEFDDQMPALVAAALRRSIPPAPFATAPKAASKPSDQAAPKPAPAAPKPVAAAPKPAPAAPKPVVATAPTIMAQAAPKPAPAAPKPVVATAPTIMAQAAPRPVPAPAAPISADALAAEAREISTALEDALEIDFRESIPPVPAKGSRPDGVPFLRDKRKIAIAAACLAVVVFAIAAVALVASREGERAPAEAVRPAAPPREPAEPAPVVAAPAAPVAEPVAPVAEPAAPVAEPAAPVAEPAAPVEAKHTKKPGGAYQPPAAKKPQPSQEKKKPAPPKGAEGLASNPFGE
jgi:hypothetical protein